MPDEVFRALTGYAPRPWQSQLLSRMCASATGEWPEVCPVPTGMGKSFIPVLALIAMGFNHSAPRRIVYTVNRRLIVDEAYTKAEDAANALRDPSSIEDADRRETIIAFRTQFLCALGLSDPDVRQEAESAPSVHLLRGGLEERLDRIESPVVPLILVSTLDQCMSRLLLRGYGMRKQSWPVQAGLLAYDTLWIVDEAHISDPAVATLKRVRDAILESDRGAIIGKPLIIMQTTATPRVSFEPLATSDPGECRIVNAAKFVSVKMKTKKTDTLAKAAKRDVSQWINDPGVRRIAVIVNSIRTAREVFNSLNASLSKHKRRPRLVLLIGAIRSSERKQLSSSDVLADLRQGVIPDSPVIAVATQTIEAGADFDFDCLFSEGAPLDSLAQRFGRCNRSGMANNPRGIIWWDPSEDSPIYGESGKDACALLATLEQPINFSPAMVSALIAGFTDEERLKYLSPQSFAELLYAQRVRDLGRTFPPSYDETDVAYYIHGKISGEVQICWRGDVDDNLLEAMGSPQRGAKKSVEEWLDASPVSRDEVCGVSVSMARAFLADAQKTNASDGEDFDSDGKGGKGRAAIAIRNGEAYAANARSVRSGDLLIVPGAYGWHDEFGINPESVAPVSDLSLPEHASAVTAFSLPLSVLVDSYDDEGLDATVAQSEITGYLSEKAAQGDGVSTKILAALNSAKRVVIRIHPLDDQDDPSRLLISLTPPSGCMLDDDTYGVEITLDDHCDGVGRKANAYARILNCSSGESACLEMGGKLHDIGKASSIFQAYRLGNKNQDKILAKSAKKTRIDPRVGRHERASINMLPPGVDTLTRHLIGTHHGYGRPLFPDSKHVSFERITYGDLSGPSESDENMLGSDWSRSFDELCRRYSPWGLSYLEAILRCADWRVSAEERGEEDQPPPKKSPPHSRGGRNVRVGQPVQQSLFDAVPA